ncbi:MAG: hypothetical protein ABIS45_08055, partial [Burkholderiales bacterium]
QGVRRLDRPDDWVRREIAMGLARNILVLPVLVDGAKMPLDTELPTEIRPLVAKQASDISDSRWDYDVGEIYRELERVVPPRPESEERDSPWPGRLKKGFRWIGWSVVGGAALLAAAATVSILTETKPGDYSWAVEPPQVRFDWDPKSTEAKIIDVRVTNIGKKSARFTFSVDWTSFTPSAGVLTISDSTCEAHPVPPNAVCGVKVVFDPRRLKDSERDQAFNGQLWIAVLNKSVNSIPLTIRQTAP